MAITRLTIVRSDGGGIEWDIIVDGIRVDSLALRGSRTIERAHGFTAFVAGFKNEVRIQVSDGENKTVYLSERPVTFWIKRVDKEDAEKESKKSGCLRFFIVPIIIIGLILFFYIINQLFWT